MNDFRCNCGFGISAEHMENEDFMEYAIKEHNEQHLAWRTAYVLGFFFGEPRDGFVIPSIRY